MIVGLVLIVILAIHMLLITCYIMGMLTTINRLPLKPNTMYIHVFTTSLTVGHFYSWFPFWVHSHTGVGHYRLLQQHYAQVESRGQRGQL